MSQLFLLALLSASLPSCFGVYSGCGWFLECWSGQVATGICSSSTNPESCEADDGNKICELMNCNDWMSFSSPSATGRKLHDDMSENNPADAINGWQCGGSGEKLECGNNSAIIGTCGSAKDSVCGKNCEGGANHAIKCAKAPAPLAVQKGEWMDPATATTVDCPENSVACGYCASGGDANCDGNWTRLKCCPIVDCTPTYVNATWEPVGSGSFEGDVVELKFGVALGLGIQLTEEMSKTIMESIAGGFDFCGLSGSVSVSEEFSKMISIMVEASVEVSVGASRTVSCGSSPFQLWRLKIQTDSACPTVVFTDAYACTKTAANPPCCLPGYSLNSDYSECVPQSPNLCDL